MCAHLGSHLRVRVVGVSNDFLVHKECDDCECRISQSEIACHANRDVTAEAEEARENGRDKKAPHEDGHSCELVVVSEACKEVEEPNVEDRETKATEPAFL